MIDLRDKLHLDDSGTIDVTGKLRDWFKTRRSGFLPIGSYLTHDPIILDHQRLVGESAGYTAADGTTILCAGDGFRLGKFAGLETLNVVRVGGMGGTGVRLTINGQDSNCCKVIGVRIAGFDLGLDNQSSDGSELSGGALYSNRINGRTNTNEIFPVNRTPSSGALDCGWEILSSGGGLTLNNVDTTNNPTHVRLATGARLFANHCWFETGVPEVVAAVDGFSNGVDNTRAVFTGTHRMAGSLVPFVKFRGGFLQYIACDGEPELNFEVGNAQVLGQGEQGIKNGQPYTAGGYPPTL